VSEQVNDVNRELARSNRALRMLSDSNQALIRATDERVLLREVCQNTITGGYHLAWVALIDDVPATDVRVAAHAGAWPPALVAETMARCDLITEAVETGVATVREDLAALVSNPARELELAAGCRAAIVLPLIIEDRTLGALLIYAAAPTTFDDAERAILWELAGDVAYGLAALRTRAERDQMLVELARTNRAFEAAEHLAGVGHFEHHLARHELTASPEAHRIWGSSPAAFTLETLNQRVAPEDRPGVAAAIAAMLEAPEPMHFNYRIERDDGEQRTVHVHAIAERDAEGRPHSIIGSMLDITEARRLEDALRAAEVRVRMIVEAVPDLITLYDRDARLQYANPAAIAAAGRPLAAMHGRSLDELADATFGGPELAVIDASMRRVIATGVPERLELEVRLPDGVRPIEIRHVPERDDRGAILGVLAVARDLTELRTSQARLEMVTSALDEVVWLSDATRTAYTYVSSAFERTFGASERELLADASAWTRRIVPDDRVRFAAAVDNLASTASFDLEYRIRTADGTMRWLRDRAAPMRDAVGTVTQLAGVTADVTRHRSLEEQVRQAEKLDAVGQLAGGIAHDFNNLLAIIQIQASVLLDDRFDRTELIEGVGEIIAASERAANLTRQLLTFSRRAVAQPIELDLSTTINDLLKLLRRVLGEGIEVDARRLAVGLFVEADPGMIEQAVMCLALNARDAMPDGGRLSIEVTAATVDAERATRHGVRPGPYVALAVSDTGHGISDTDREHLFEPFFTTKEVGHGSGLGLATVFGVVQQHHGFLEVDSEPGRGTTFRAMLPAIDADPTVAETSRTLALAAGGRETILLVEDETMLRTTARLVLERHGYHVLEAESAGVALALWDAVDGAVDLLLTDLILPGTLTGRQLADALIARAPTLSIVYTTGYEADVLGGVLRRDAQRTLLRKPYAGLALVMQVRQALDARAARAPA
jgi:PAS domain S-box-containing protein